MKRIIAVVVLSVLVAFLCFADIGLADKTYNSLSRDLENCRAAFRSGDYETAEKYAKELEKNWTEREDVFSIFINHELIDDMGVSVSKLVPLAECRNDMFWVECRIIELTLKHIKNDSSVNLHSVF